MRKSKIPVDVKVALEAVKGLKTQNEVASEYGVHPVQVGQWKKELLAALPSIWSSKTAKTEQDHKAEKAALFELIGRLQVENDWLKKKLES